MTAFAVSFEPEIPRGGSEPPPAELNWSTVWEIVKDQPEYDPTFTISGERFGYYPTDLGNVLLDLLGELQRLDSGENHIFSLCGYTILSVEVGPEAVAFIDPALEPTYRYDVPRAEVRSALAAASTDVWSYIQSLRTR